MAIITPTLAGESGEVSVSETTLGASDTFVFKRNAKQRLILRNDTVGALTPLIVGDESTTVGIDGVGSIDVSGGFQVSSMAADAVVSINTDSIRERIKGTIEITGGTGIVAILMEG